MTKPDDTADFGDYVQHAREEIDVEMEAESFEAYDEDDNNPGVFYPIYLGEVLGERYLIEHKLGHGGGATVWMAHDLKEKLDVAIKVMKTGSWGENEIRMQTQVLKDVQDDARLVTCLTTFFLSGPHGQHQVLVFPLVGPSIQSFVLMDRIPMKSRMSAARQLLEVLESLHDAGIVHRGEFGLHGCPVLSHSCVY